VRPGVGEYAQGIRVDALTPAAAGGRDTLPAPRSTREFGGRTLEQWQIKVTGAARI
jgi:hypothetical protein